MADPHRHLTEYGTLYPNSLYNTVWLDAMHDRMNYKATQATTDEDSLMTVNRHWPVALNAAPESFLQLFKEKYILQPKDNVINAIPGEMRIKDVYSGLFFGFALNEFIDQADTSTENYLKYYQTNNRLLINTPFDGLDKPPTGGDFPNSYLYNCDKILFEYFISLTTTPVVPGTTNYKYPYVDTASVDGGPAGPAGFPPVLTDWNTANCKQRHVYNLNCFWQELIETIHNDHIDVSGADDFDVNDINAAIEQLKRIEFTGFEMIKKDPRFGAPRGTGWIDFLYKYPKWKIKDVDNTEYFYVTTQGLCASHIPSGATKPNVLSRKLGKITKEQKSCFKGLKRLAYVILLNDTPLTDDAKSHFFMLLKYAGDTSHLKLYEILNAAIPDDDLYKTNNLALYLSERPLLVRAFTKNMNVYCKYLAKFKDENIIKTPNEVFKLTNIGENVIGFMRAKNYMQDINDLIGIYNQHSDLNYLALEFVSLQTPDDDQASLGQASQLQDTTDVVPNPIPYIDHAIEVAKPNIDVKLPQPDQDKIDQYHNSIKQILSLNQLIIKTPSFIDDMKYVNERIIARKFFPTKTFRCPIIMHLKSVACPMIRSAFNKKNIEIFNRALQYLNAFNTLRAINPPPVDDLIGDTLVDIYDQLNTDLEREILSYGDKFKRLNQISIDGGDGIRVMLVDPSILREWIYNEYTSDSSMSNKLTDVGIQNITDYLILYDTLTHSVPVGQTGTGGGAAAQDGGSAEDFGAAEYSGKMNQANAINPDHPRYIESFLELDDELIEQEDEIIAEAIDPAIDPAKRLGYIQILNKIDTLMLDIESSPGDLSTVDLMVSYITERISTILDDVIDVDFLETLYYVLQQFIYFNERYDQYTTQKGEVISFNEMTDKYITQAQLTGVTLDNISKTIYKIYHIAVNFTDAVEVIGEVELYNIGVAGRIANKEAIEARLAQEYAARLAQEYAAQTTETAGAAAVTAAAAAVGMSGMSSEMDPMKEVPRIINITTPPPPPPPRSSVAPPQVRTVTGRAAAAEYDPIAYNELLKEPMPDKMLVTSGLVEGDNRSKRSSSDDTPTPERKRGRVVKSPSVVTTICESASGCVASGGANKTRKKSKSSQLRKTIKKRILKKIKRKSLRRKKPIKKRVNSKNRKVKRKIKNKTRKYKKPKKQKRSRKPKHKP